MTEHCMHTLAKSINGLLMFKTEQSADEKNVCTKRIIRSIVFLKYIKLL